MTRISTYSEDKDKGEIQETDERRDPVSKEAL
jgi:hypothetical protein